MSTEPENPAPNLEPPSHIDTIDAQGQRTRVPRDDYAKKVLPDLLKASDNDPDRLTAIIMQSVRDGFAEEVMPAANRLTVIDKDNIERALTVLAVGQRDCDELELAEGTLNELLQRKPGSPAAPPDAPLL